MTELINLLQAIIDDATFSEYAMDGVEDVEFHKICERYFRRFGPIYKRIERHSYFEISSFLRQVQKKRHGGDKLDMLVLKMSCIVKHAEYNNYDKDANGNKNKECYKHVFKLTDHIKLETSRISEAKKVDEAINDFNIDKNDTVQMIGTANEAVKNARNKSRKLTEQVISILGIFAGIIVAFSFSVTTIGEALANLTNVNAVHLAFVICALGFVFINAVSLLMVFVALLSGFNLRSPYIWIVYGAINTALVILGVLLYIKSNELILLQIGNQNGCVQPL